MPEDRQGKPRLGSLFAGIGGFDLGFERAGFETVWQVEIDEYCRRVLERHFPRAERFGDIRECGKHNLKPVDVICGGFPCQDVSHAGPRHGIDGQRSGLWREMRRIIGELRPRFAVVENVAALLGRGIERVCGDLAEIGYDAEWATICASHVGLPHLRERLWLVAYPSSDRLQGRIERDQENQRNGNINAPILSPLPLCRTTPHNLPSPYIAGTDDGIPNRAHRIKALGNAVVPQIAQWIAERIKAVMECEP